MPTYLGQAVSDDFLQTLIAAYRDGQRDAGAPVEDGDQVVIDRLASHEVMSARAPSAFELGVSDGKS